MRNVGSVYLIIYLIIYINKISLFIYLCFHSITVNVHFKQPFVMVSVNKITELNKQTNK